jgi:hypothetical protein
VDDANEKSGRGGPIGETSVNNCAKHIGLAVALLVVGGGLRPIRAQMVLTPAGQAQGLGLTTFASGFSDFSGQGPFGIAFPATGGVLVSDVKDETVRLFPTDTDNQNAANAKVGQIYSSNNVNGMTQAGGNIYMAQPGDGDLAQINNNGTFNQVIVSGIPRATGVAADPFNGHIFVSNVSNNQIFDVDPIAKTKTLFVNANADGLSFSPDGRILYAAIDGGSSAGHILGFDTTSKALVFDSGFIPGGVDGTAAGTGLFSNFVFVNTNGGTLVEVNLNTSVQTTIATGGSRGDFVTVDASNNTLLITQSTSILRLTGASFTSVPEPGTVVLTGVSALLALGAYGVDCIRRTVKRNRSVVS